MRKTTLIAVLVTFSLFVLNETVLAQDAPNPEPKSPQEQPKADPGNKESSSEAEKRASPAKLRQEIIIRRRTLPKGTKVTIKSSWNIDEAQEHELSEVYEVLKVSKRYIRRYKSEFVLKGKKNLSFYDAMDGTVIVADYKDGAFKIDEKASENLEKGNSIAEMQLLAVKHNQLRGFAGILPSRAIKPGAVFKIPKALISADLNMPLDEATDFPAHELVFKSVQEIAGRKVARFAINIVMISDLRPGQKLQVTQQGHINIDPNGNRTIDSNIDLTATPLGMPNPSSRSWNIVRKYTYSEPAPKAEKQTAAAPKNKSTGSTRANDKTKDPQTKDPKTKDGNNTETAGD